MIRDLHVVLLLILVYPVYASDPTPRAGSAMQDNRNAGARGMPAGIPSTAGIYVLNDASNLRPTAAGYASGLTQSPAYQHDITGHAIFVPIAKILPSITTWGQFNWDWRFLDTLVQIALSNGKKFSIELETGYQSSTTYLQSLPVGFLALAGATSAPLFDVWTTGGAASRGISAYVLLPWVTKVQEFWSAAASALAAHLQSTGAYGSLTLVHLPGLSVYDEELRLPTGFPRPAATDTSHCPDGRLAYTAVIDDASTLRWQSLGYSDSAVVSGFAAIASAFAGAFPDRVLGVSLFPTAVKGIDFPNLTSDSVGYVASQIVKAVTDLAPGRVQVQADDLDANYIEAEVVSLSTLYADAVGWQSNKHGGPGAGCGGGGAGSCSPDGPTGPYFQLLKNGWQAGGRYMEVWSADVVGYPQGLAAAAAAGFYSLTDAGEGAPPAPPAFRLFENYPNPFNPSTTISFTLDRQAHVRLAVYDVLGKVLNILVDQERPPGRYLTRWAGVDQAGAKVSSGVYFLRLQAGSAAAVREMVLAK